MRNVQSRRRSRGSITLIALVFGAVGVIIITSLMELVYNHLRTAMDRIARERALHIAEAGVDYTRWHLAHNVTDFQDGTGRPGPYVHDVKNPNGEVIGQYSLDITAPSPGSTLVTLRSSGTPSLTPVRTRTIQARLAIPSVAQYAVAGNEALRFGEETDIAGPVHANGGVRFDGVARNVVSSSVETYDDPDHEGPAEAGVHTHRSDPSAVFLAGTQVGAPPISFSAITADLAQIKRDAQAGGTYLAPSGVLGYHVVLRTSDEVDIYRVRRLESPRSGCSNQLNQEDWGTWSIASNGEDFVERRAFPANGLLFVEDHAWVDGAVDGARLTIVAANLDPAVLGERHITVNRSLTYTRLDGSDAIGLFAQRNVNVGLISDTDLRIHAGLVAQTGRVGRYYYASACGSESFRQSLTLYGMIITNRRYGFAYTDGSGYAVRRLTYDPNFRYAPPPATPLTSTQYEVISWEER